jgi:lysophospholipase L1-like esterase
MHRVLLRWTVAFATAAGALFVSTAPAGAAAWLASDVTHPGVIDLIYEGPVGAHVEFFEQIDGGLQRLGSGTVSPTGRGRLHQATTWRCDQRIRHFAATAVAPDGSVTHGTSAVRTRPCKERFELSAPRRAAVGAKPRIRVTDRWAIGNVKPKLCIDPPRAKRTCRMLAFRKAVTVASRRFRVTTTGRWRVQLRLGSVRIRRSVAVGHGVSAGPPPPPTLLATGDSTMQGIDTFLADRLASRATVRSEVLPGSNISQIEALWRKRAASQALRLRPRTTVISVGANDGFGMRTPAGQPAPCCGVAWIAEYARRVRTMMKSYIRGGRGRILWLTLPLPRDPRRSAISTSVNQAIQLAATGLENAVVVRLEDVFTPRGYTDVIRWRGQYVRVREPDGIHLNLEGTSIAAEIVELALRAVEQSRTSHMRALDYGNVLPTAARSEG